MYEVAERNARQKVEAVHGLDRNGIGRSREVLGVEIGGDVAPPIELPIAEDRDAKITRIGGEQSQIMEILLAEDIDGRLRSLDRHVELVAPFLPRGLQRRTAVEGHHLRRARVPPPAPKSPRATRRPCTSSEVQRNISDQKSPPRLTFGVKVDGAASTEEILCLRCATVPFQG